MMILKARKSLVQLWVKCKLWMMMIANELDATYAYLAEEPGVGVAGAGRAVTDGAGAGSPVLHRTASICVVAVEDLCDAAFRGIGNPGTEEKVCEHFFMDC